MPEDRQPGPGEGEDERAEDGGAAAETGPLDPFPDGPPANPEQRLPVGRGLDAHSPAAAGSASRRTRSKP